MGAAAETCDPTGSLCATDESRDTGCLEDGSAAHKRAVSADVDGVGHAYVERWNWCGDGHWGNATYVRAIGDEGRFDVAAGYAEGNYWEYPDVHGWGAGAGARVYYLNAWAGVSETNTSDTRYCKAKVWGTHPDGTWFVVDLYGGGSNYGDECPEWWVTPPLP